jgi:hypothetical protein
MTTRPMVSQPVLQRPRTPFLTCGFLVLALALVLHQALVVIPAYRGGLVFAYNAGWRLKDLSLPVPIYTPYSIVTNLLFFPVLLLIAFVTWVAPALTLIWGIRLGQLWRQLPARTKWGWLAIVLALWVLTLLTKTASTAFLIWLLD